MVVSLCRILSHETWVLSPLVGSGKAERPPETFFRWAFTFGGEERIRTSDLHDVKMGISYRCFPHYRRKWLYNAVSANGCHPQNTVFPVHLVGSRHFVVLLSHEISKRQKDWEINRRLMVLKANRKPICSRRLSESRPKHWPLTASARNGSRPLCYDRYFSLKC